jgi:hypothetical protein
LTAWLTNSHAGREQHEQVLVVNAVMLMGNGAIIRAKKIAGATLFGIINNL